MSKINLILGLQWGDEGKGKIVDVLTEQHDTIARFQGGPNAGHTLVFDGQKHVLHTIPSGIFHTHAMNIIGGGVVIDPVILNAEIIKLKVQEIDYKKTLKIARSAHLILPTHRLLDAASEASKGKAKIGSTLKGIGPTYMDKTGRNGLRVGDLELPDWKEKYQKLTQKHLKMIANYQVNLDFDLEQMETEFFKGLKELKEIPFIDQVQYMQENLVQGKKILAEGAQGSLLDINFGTYPFVTSSTTTAAGACIGLGIAPNQIGEVIGIFKAYTTRVGSGPFPTELFDNYGKKMAEVGHEFGATTGRPRRCGWLDLVALKYAVQLNGVTQLAMMKSDVLSGFDQIKVCTSYEYRGETIGHFPFDIDEALLKPNYSECKAWQEDLTQMTKANELPKELKKYIAFIENYVGVPVKIVSVGPDRAQTIILN